MAEKETWFQKLFINEAKPALDRHSGGTEEIILQEKETNENGVVTPDEGYDGLGSVTVNIPDPPLQEKIATANGTVTPDAEYYGLSKVEVSIADAPVLQEKEATGNGEILPDEGYDGLSKVTVNAPSSLKKFLDASKTLKSHFKDNEDITDLTGIIEYSDTENVTDMYDTFYGCSNLTTMPLFDTSKVTTMNGAFGFAPLSEIPFFNTENVTDMSRMFGNGSSYSPNVRSKIKTVPHFNTSKVTNMSTMFGQCRLLESVPLFDTSNVTSMSNMFYDCQKLTSVPHFNTSKVTSMSKMFYNCQKITSVPHFNTSKVTDMSYMFYGCSNLTTMPLFDTRNATNMSYMFYSCKVLSVIPALDMRSVTSISSFLNSYCINLTECWIKNIKVALQVGSGETYGHLLTMDSLLNLLNETVYNTSSTKKLTIGSANLAKFTGDYEYVKPTGKYLDLDDNEVDTLTANSTKIPVVWCSSTDEGAVTVADYMASKGWSLA